jgi:serine/threonine protein kinase
MGTNNKAVFWDCDPRGRNDGVPSMSPPDLTSDDSVLADDLAGMIAACERFECAWKAGRPPLIEDELNGARDSIRPRLFRELLALELELTRRDGRFIDQSAYLARFPDRADEVREVFACETVTVPFPEETDPGINDELGSSPVGYDLLRELGTGGQATTFLARDRALHRLVVLKRYHGAASSSRREAVLNEGRALARVRSPFVAPCLGVETRDDEIDLVVEYVPGRSLTDLTPEDRAKSRRCALLVEQVATGLAEVHACGLLHRDIKPQNIILGDDGVPRLVDFGLAVPLASEALHAVSGSPPYMAPEQARGQGERVDARTDVYGLGAVLYYLLTGKPPHDGSTLNKILEQARDAAVVPPRRLNRRVPRGLERICKKAMAADPRFRYSSADALREALRRHRLMRITAPVAMLLALVVPAWALWPVSGPSDGEGQIGAITERVVKEPQFEAKQSTLRPAPEDPGGAITERVTRESQVEAKQATSVGLRVTRFEIPHFPKLDEKSYDVQALGVLGKKSFTARVDDDVIVRAELSEPAYSYLIAYRPDGSDELCDPDDENTPPPRKQRPQYPPPTKNDERYRLSEGTGLYAFGLVVSRRPLPSYREWKERSGPVAWAARLPYEPGVIWLDDGAGLQPLMADQTTGTRGKGAKVRDSGGPAAKLASWLRGLPGVDAVTVEAFPVEPAAGR